MSATVTAQQVQEKVFSSLVEFGADPDAVTPEAGWGALDVDSLDLVELAQVVEEEFGVEITSQDMQNLPTVGSVIELVVARAS
jgi:acyl carrier protein